MNLLLCELKKTFVSKTTVIFLIIAVTINVITLYINESVSSGSSLDLSIVRDIDEKLMHLDENQAKDFLNEHIIAMEYALSLTSEIPLTPEKLVLRYPGNNIEKIIADYNNGVYDGYIKNPYAIGIVLRQKLEEVDVVYSYDEYREEINRIAIRMQTSPMFADSHFAKHNAKKTAEAFSNLNISNLRFNSSKGVTLATKNGITPIYLLVACLFICFLVYIHDKDNNTLTLLRTMRKGRKHLMLSKIISALILGLVTTFLLSVSSYLTGYVLYGFGDINMPLQSVFGFQSCIFELSVLQYLIVYIPMLMLSVIFVLTLMMFIFVSIKDSIVGVIIVASIFTISIVMHNSISSVSFFSIFKYLNLYFLLDAGKIISNYLNINMAGYPLSFVPIFFITVITSSVILSLVTINIFKGQKDIQGSYLKRNIRKIKTSKAKKINTGIFCFEAYKCIIINPVLPILIIFLLFQLLTVKAYPPEQRLATKDYIYMYYMKKLEGPISNEKTLTLEKMLKEVQTENNQDASSLNRDKISVILNLISKDSSLNLLKDSTEDINIKNRISFVYEKGYNEFFNDDYLSRKAALYSLLLVILCTVDIFAMEKKNNTYSIITSTVHGRKRTFINKSIISCIIAFLVMSAAYIPLIIKIARESGFACFNSPIACINGMENFPLNVSISEYFILLFILKFIGIVISISIINFVSHITGERIMTIAITLPVIVIPAFLAFMGADSFSNILFNVYLYGNNLMSLGQWCVVQAATLVVIGLLLFYILYMKYNKNRI
ncbi:MAG: hypothetical protein PHC31_03030 [Clostridia bacterium]|nr:hypothetical protein [Clostridia bacterium]